MMVSIVVKKEEGTSTNRWMNLCRTRTDWGRWLLKIVAAGFYYCVYMKIARLNCPEKANILYWATWPHFVSMKMHVHCTYKWAINLRTWWTDRMSHIYRSVKEELIRDVGFCFRVKKSLKKDLIKNAVFNVDY